MSGFIVWFTGLPCAGKTTLALSLAERLEHDGSGLEILDGDAVRTFLSRGLGFSREDRIENTGRVAYVALLLARNGVNVITSTISPYGEGRRRVRLLADRERVPFVEVYANASLTSAMQRDVKGLYLKAQRGEIENFTGISDPYEAPTAPEVECRTDVETVDQSTQKIMDVLMKKGLV